MCNITHIFLLVLNIYLQYWFADLNSIFFTCSGKILDRYNQNSITRVLCE